MKWKIVTLDWPPCVQKPSENQSRSVLIVLSVLLTKKAK